MFDRRALIEKLESLLDALNRIPRRFTGIETPEDFTATDSGLDRMDAICMILIAAGEELKGIDRKTEGNLLARYPAVNWAGVTAVRNVLAHGYFDVDTEELFDICRDDVPELINTIARMIRDLREISH